MIAIISPGEKQFIREGCKQDIRYDGRACHDFRGMSIENNIYPHTNGSSRVRIGDVVDVICSVKLEVIQPSLSNPTSGNLDISVDISPSTSITMDGRTLDSAGAKIAADLQSILLDSDALDLETLSIIAGKFSWCLHVDLLVLRMDGNVLDVCSIAAFAGLNSTRIPKTELIVGDSGEMEDFDVIGSLSEGHDLNTTNVPICITVAKIGDSFVMDASGPEQECADCVLSIGIGEDGSCCGVSYIKSGAISVQDMAKIVSQASMGARAIWAQLRHFVDQPALSASVDSMYPDQPVARAGLLV